MTFFNRKFGYVDFASEEDMQKALELNGKKVMGQELKLDRARSKDSSQEGKKGKNNNKRLLSECMLRKVKTGMFQADNFGCLKFLPFTF